MQVGYELMVFAWPERPSAIPAEKSVDVPDGMEAFAFCGTERDEEHRALQQKSWCSHLITRPPR